MLKSSWTNSLIEAGCDEAGRGCLCGPVVAAAVIWDRKLEHELINDSKKLSYKQRKEMSLFIKENAIDFAISCVSEELIDLHNILNASIHAMHLAVEQLQITPEIILVDGNKFHPYPNIPHECIVKGDSKVRSIAAASILAKNHRDELMLKLHEEFPLYGWDHNFGYATQKHREALTQYGPTPYHRKSFRLDYS